MGLFDKWKKMTNVYADDVIVAVADGEMISPENISDMTFSKELMGQTIGFQITNGKIVSPANGKIEVLFPSKHAFAVRMKNGTGLLVHIGIDTVSLNGKGFHSYVKQGDEVHANDPIIEVDLEAVHKAGLETTTMLVVTEPVNKEERISFIDYGKVNRGQIITK